MIGKEEIIKCTGARCPYSDGVISWRDKAFDNGRLASCGIVPISSHGRLIDADILDSSETDYLGNHLVYLVDIDNAPTIIPAEEGDR